MFGQKTVFILGAGASWHYGYPTGEELVFEVIECTKKFRKFCARRKVGFNIEEMPKFLVRDGLPAARGHEALVARWQEHVDLCDDLIARLTAVEPVVIDYFLGWNQHLHDLGRMMIAGALLTREASGAGVPYPPREIGVHGRLSHSDKHNWIRFIVHQLLMDCSTSKEFLEKNDVHFITFNYDLSFERNLRAALAAVGFIEPADLEKFFEQPRILHIYGSLAAGVSSKDEDILCLTNNFDDNGGLARMYSATDVINSWYAAAEDLKVIDPTKETGPCKEAAALLVDAERIFFLGFSFDKQNCTRLGLPLAHLSGRSRHISFTNFRDAQAVNKNAGRVLRAPAMWRDDAPVVFAGSDTIERSTRNTYDAIALDFGTLA